MTDRELMQQALGYMESVGQMDMHPEEWAIAVALRERLAQPDPSAYWHNEFLKHNTTSEQPAQQQEPVAGKPLPCPFCGHKGLDFDEGSTYRWGVASCSGCGASCGEIRREYPDQGQWHTEAIAEWNRRTPQPASKPLTEEQFLELILRNGTVELVGACTFVGGSIQMQGKMGLLRSAKIIKEFVEAAHGITGESK